MNKTWLTTSLLGSMLLAGCLPNQPVTERDAPAKSIKKNPALSQSILNYQLQELREIDLTQQQSQFNDGYDDLWHKIFDHYQLNYSLNQAIKAEIQFYQRHHKTIPAALNRSTPYLHIVVNEIHKRNMPMEIAFLPIIESSYNTTSLSRANAAGMWQITAPTAKVRGVTLDSWYDGRYDVYDSTIAALDLLQDLHQRFNEDWLLALAAYNWGEFNVRKAINQNKAQKKPTDYWHLTMPTETKRFVPKLIAVSQMIKQSNRYQIALPDIPNAPQLTRIQLTQPIDLKTAAKMSDMSWSEFQRFNAGHLTKQTKPESAGHLLVPISKLSAFANNIINFEHFDQHSTVAATGTTNQATVSPTRTQPLEQKPNTSNNKTPLSIVHKLKHSQPLAKVADYYAVSLQSLVAANGIHSKTKLKVGQPVIIPIKSVKEVVIKKGDTWSTLAQKNKVPVHVLLTFNKADHKQRLKIGQKIKVPTMA